MGLPPEVADALLIISRVPGLAAHALEEQRRESPMRVINPTAELRRARGKAGAGETEIGDSAVLTDRSIDGLTDWRGRRVTAGSVFAALRVRRS